MIVQNPLFGGMSGIVYGLLGYLWIRGKYDPSYGIRLNPQIVMFMLGWFVLCLTGLVGHVANVVHGAGLFMGAAWGYLASKHWLRVFRR
ncbi:MAG: rhomboid family intramembrane serine protease [Myxococcales bacterium]|nr:MAG: rhomboid family intramembrane serine protease [Myxococcales bacterium]